MVFSRAAGPFHRGQAQHRAETLGLLEDVEMRPPCVEGGEPLAHVLESETHPAARRGRGIAGILDGDLERVALAAGLDAAFALSDSRRRKGQTPTIILLTDGRANIARDGGPGRPRAEADAMSAARQLRAAGITTVLVDTSPRPGALAENFAREMGARYLPLPHADATTLSKAVLASVR